MRHEHSVLAEVAERAFARASDAPLVGGNAVRLLRDAGENYPAWLAAIRSATRSIMLECYIVADDEVGHQFLDALTERALAGVQVRVIYDWLGSFRGRRMWERLWHAGAEVRAFNVPRLDEPFGWITRDHRKMLAVDGCLGYVSGLCIGSQWNGDPGRGIEPWRDTGVEIRGPAVLALESAFAQTWAGTGSPLGEEAFTPAQPSPAGEVALRVVAGMPTNAGMFRVDQLICAIARERLWLTDAYFVGVTPYVRALCAAAHDGVDVRLLVPGASDLPVISRLSRTGYRPLLEAGVRVFEWNGSMLHAKTAVADGRWARVGSTNLNIASWVSNYELDVAIEDLDTATEMEAMFEKDLSNATEIVLGRHKRMTASQHRHGKRAFSGSATRAAAGALTMGSAFSAALGKKRVLEPAEAASLATIAAVMCMLGLIALFWPRVIAIPVFLLCLWVGLAMLWRALKLRTKRDMSTKLSPENDRRTGP